MNILIIGCGRIGQALAKDLALGSDNVVVVDNNQQILSHLGERFNGQIVLGDALSLEALERAGISNADIVFVITGNDNLNLVIAQIALKIYGRKKIIVQVYDLEKSHFYQNKGFIIVNRTSLFLENFKKHLH
ncbi:MAG: TrkA family potassium uptake protein [Candidatus Omnitrophica bacterium]|nr:TrkA family potassium uptake protein [Candidatus Omnitrophota bacterium]